MSTRRKKSNPLQSDDLITPEDLEREIFSEADSQGEAPTEELTESFPPEGTLELFTNVITEELTESFPPEEPQEPSTSTTIEELTESFPPEEPQEPSTSTIEVVTETPEPPAPFKSRSRPLKPLRQRNIPRFSSFLK